MDEEIYWTKRRKLGLYVVIIASSLTLLLAGVYYASYESKKSHDNNVARLYACQTFDQVTNYFVPEDVQNFHYSLARNAKAKEIVRITWFPCPYPNFYYILVFYANKKVVHWRNVPGWAEQGGAAGELTDNEYTSLEKSLNELSEITAHFSDNNGSYLIAMSTKDRNDSLFVCTERTCPGEIETWFALAENAFRRRLAEEQAGGGFMDRTPFNHGTTVDVDQE